MRELSRRGWITAGVVLVLLIVLAIVAWPRGRQLPPARAREYRNVDACLLTGPAGITETQAAAVWAGMQDASAATLARVSYLAVVGPETQANTLPFVQSLIQRHCVVIVATGPVEVSAAAGLARGHADITFILVGGTASAANVSIIQPEADNLQPAVAEALRGVLR